MSIASEITDLQTNLQNAKDAVEDKGGTVGDTGLAGLATEIASIPSGGGSADTIPVETEGVTGSGHITGYNSTTGVITGDGFGSTAGSVWLLDRDTHSYKKQTTSSWSDISITLATPIDTSVIEGYTSIAVEDANHIWTTKWMIDGDISITATYGYLYVRDKSTGSIEKVVIDSVDSSTHMNTAGFNRRIDLSNKTFYSDDVVGAMLNNSSLNSSYVLAYMQNLNQPIKLPAGAWGSSNCLRSALALNQPVGFYDNQQDKTLGDWFMGESRDFNQPITLNYYARGIGSRFLYHCFAFNQEFVINDRIQSVSTYFLEQTSVRKITINTTGTLSNYFMASLLYPATFVINTTVSTMPNATNSVSADAASNGLCVAYQNGFTFKGSQRSAWLTQFPNSVNPYRYVIDGGE